MRPPRISDLNQIFITAIYCCNMVCNIVQYCWLHKDVARASVRVTYGSNPISA